MQGNINKHANDCSEIIASLMSERCNRELISKAGLEKHIKRCKGDERPAIIPKSKQKKIVPIMDQSVDPFKEKNVLVFLQGTTHYSFWQGSQEKTRIKFSCF